MAYIAMASGSPCVVPSLDCMHCSTTKGRESLRYYIGVYENV